VQKLKMAVCGMGSFALAFAGTYLFLAKIWTHVFARPENVTATDFYLVVALSAIAGIAIAILAVRVLARRLWTPRHGVHHEAHA